jgi:hypothetical protein
MPPEEETKTAAEAVPPKAYMDYIAVLGKKMQMLKYAREIIDRVNSKHEWYPQLSGFQIALAVEKDGEKLVEHCGVVFGELHNVEEDEFLASIAQDSCDSFSITLFLCFELLEENLIAQIDKLLTKLNMTKELEAHKAETKERKHQKYLEYKALIGKKLDEFKKEVEEGGSSE